LDGVEPYSKAYTWLATANRNGYAGTQAFGRRHPTA